MKSLKQLLLLILSTLFLSHCFEFQPPRIVEYQFQKSEDPEEEKPVVIMQRSILTAVKGDKCIDKSETHLCYEQCKKMYYWHGSDVRECQKNLTIPQINILEETFDFLWEPDFAQLQSIPPDNFKAYLSISDSALNRIIRKYGSREVEHFMLWIISNEEITNIFDKTDHNFERLADLLYRVAPYTEKTVYEPFIEKVGDEELMSALIKYENETAMSLFLDFINDTNKDCSRETVSKDCFSIYCSIGRGISNNSRRDWRYFKDFGFYLSEIVDYQINSQQGQGRDRNSEGWIYKGRNSGSGISEGDDVSDFVKDLCQGLGYPD